jgi:hypothetical protein
LPFERQAAVPTGSAGLFRAYEDLLDNGLRLPRGPPDIGIVYGNFTPAQEKRPFMFDDGSESILAQLTLGRAGRKENEAGTV